MARIDDVRNYWDAHPLSAAAIPHPLGTSEYFECYDRLREANESLEFSFGLHEYRSFAGRRVLDVGCGNGYVLGHYARQGAEVFGVDLTPTAVQLCERRFELMNLSGTFLAASAEELPFEDGRFDCVCAMGVVHHTPDPEQAIAEMFRVLKPGGRLILMVYHRHSALYQLNFRLQSLLTGRPKEQLVNEVDGVGNPKGEVYSRAGLMRLLNQFEDVEIFARLLRGWMTLPKVGRFIPDRLLRPFESRWGWFLYVKGIKPRG